MKTWISAFWLVVAVIVINSAALPADAQGMAWCAGSPGSYWLGNFCNSSDFEGLGFGDGGGGYAHSAIWGLAYCADGRGLSSTGYGNSYYDSTIPSSFGYTSTASNFIGGLILTVTTLAQETDYYGSYQSNASASAHCGGSSNSSFTDNWNFGAEAYAEAYTFP
jgi:hypothetical protein